MIGRLKGVLLETDENMLLIDVHGIGYEVIVSERLATKLQSNLGKEISLYIETVVREDDILLYGFSGREEKKCFKMVTSVSGMGPKTAIAVLSVLTVSSFYQAILLGEEKVLMQVSGIGKKTAQRLILELRDKVSPEYLSTTPSESVISDFDEVSAALQSLGFEPQEYLAITNELRELGHSTNDVIRLTLKRLGEQ
ncbi:MAG TPA: Holliday junction branch migration protein RuvA [Firmicutes bacterium]|nr:Holliday junction branch migration protein RuvA [Bacillota bacterium]